MPSSADSSEPRRCALTNPPLNPGAPPPEHEHLPCPRCDSTNTKFCYYNNYNFSQPRHFCKSCRRYWTQGGTLRDIPIGGGTRKNAKRSRTIGGSHGGVVMTAAANNNNNNCHHTMPMPLQATPILLPISGNDGAFDGKGNGNGGLRGGFTSLLSTQSPGFLTLGGFGLGLGPGFEEVNFGLGRGVWPFPGMGDGAAVVGDNGAAAAGMTSTWQFENGEIGFVGGDCFPWPDLAISTPGNGLK